MDTKRIISFVLASVTAISIVGCGADSSSTSQNTSEAQSSESESVISAEEMLKAALDKVPDNNLDTTTVKGDTSDYGFDSFCKKLYSGTMPEDLDDGLISYSSTGGYADEISILKPKNADDKSKLLSILKERINVRRHDFEGYKPEELTKIDNAQVFEQDGACILIIAENAAEIKDAFKG